MMWKETSIATAVLQNQASPFEELFILNHENFLQQKNSFFEHIFDKEKKEILSQIEKVKTNKKMRTIIVTGEEGCGKSYVVYSAITNQPLYIIQCEALLDSSTFFKTLLSSLVYFIEKQSGFFQWIEDSIKAKNKETIISENKIIELCEEYKINKNIFFPILSSIYKKELHSTIIKWIGCEEINNQELRLIGLKENIKTEKLAFEIFSGLLKIAQTNPKPCVCIFDHIESFLIDEKGLPNTESLFRFNSQIHNSNIQNFCMIFVCDTKFYKKILNKNFDFNRISATINIHKITINEAQMIINKKLSSYSIEKLNIDTKNTTPWSYDEFVKLFSKSKKTPRDAMLIADKLWKIYIEKLKNIPIIDMYIENWELLVAQNLFSPEEVSSAFLGESLAEFVSALCDGVIKTGIPEIEGSFILETLHTEILFIWNETRKERELLYILKKTCEYLEENPKTNLIFLRKSFDVEKNIQIQIIFEELFSEYESYVWVPSDISITENINLASMIFVFHGLRKLAARNELDFLGENISLSDLDTSIKYSKYTSKISLKQIVEEMDKNNELKWPNYNLLEIQNNGSKNIIEEVKEKTCKERENEKKDVILQNIALQILENKKIIAYPRLVYEISNKANDIVAFYSKQEINAIIKEALHKNGYCFADETAPEHLKVILPQILSTKKETYKNLY